MSKRKDNLINPEMSPTGYERYVGDVIEKRFESGSLDLESVFKHLIDDTKLLKSLAGVRLKRRTCERRKWKGASGCKHQIDESFATGNESVILLVECKYWKNPVTIPAFSRFLVAVIDIAAEKQNSTVLGMMVTPQGIQGESGGKEEDQSCIAKLQTHFAELGYYVSPQILESLFQIKVLFLAANPRDCEQLDLDEEIRAIKEKLRASEPPNYVELEWMRAVRTEDLQQRLNSYGPHVVHFSGHASEANGLVFLDGSGNTKPVSKENIVATLETLADNIQVVVFNTCLSTGQAEAVTQHVDIAIGMNAEIGDEAARVFASQFYGALGVGLPVQTAYDWAIAALTEEGIPGEKVPELFVRADIDASKVILGRPQGAE